MEALQQVEEHYGARHRRHLLSTGYIERLRNGDITSAAVFAAGNSAAPRRRKVGGHPCLYGMANQIKNHKWLQWRTNPELAALQCCLCCWAVGFASLSSNNQGVSLRPPGPSPKVGKLLETQSFHYTHAVGLYTH